MSVKLVIDCWKECLKRPKLRIIMPIGLIREQTEPVVSTPQFQGSIERKYLMASFTMTDSQHVTLGPLDPSKFVDKKGNPSPLPAGATFVWAVDQVSLIALKPSTDGLSCDAASVGPLGTATISVKAVDASGNTLAGGSVDCNIIAGAPVTINIPVGTPAEQP